MEWKSIESAPKDGKPILLCGNNECADNEFRWCFGVGMWNATMDSWVGDKLEITGCWETGSGWFQPDEVSHWMPLPEPPLIEEGEEEAAETRGKPAFVAGEG